MKQTRTTQQNRALHKLFNDIANECLKQGVDQRTVALKMEGYTCPVTPEFVKEVFRSIMYTMYRKTSTTELATDEVDKCFDVLNKFLGEEFGIHCPFPCWEDMTLSQLDT